MTSRAICASLHYSRDNHQDNHRDNHHQDNPEDVKLRALGVCQRSSWAVMQRRSGTIIQVRSQPARFCLVADRL